MNKDQPERTFRILMSIIGGCFFLEVAGTAALVTSLPFPLVLGMCVVLAVPVAVAVWAYLYDQKHWPLA